MQAAIIILALAFPALAWILSAYAALTKLSWGRIRRMETKNKAMARRMEIWLEARNTHATALAFVAVVFVICQMAALTTVFGNIPGNHMSRTENTLTAAAAAVILLLIAEGLSNVAATLWDDRILKTAIPLALLLEKTILFPTTAISSLVAERLDKLRSGTDQNDITTTEDEILSLVEQDEPEGEDGVSLEEDEKRMIKGVFDLDNTKVREIMTPRVDLKAIPVETSLDDAVRTFVETGHSRIPVYEENVDNIKGILFAKDLLDRNKIASKPLSKLTRPPIFIPETKEVGDLLEEFKKNRNHFAVIIDEYGGTAGIVTLEDIIEEIVGEIRDEHDLGEDDAPDHTLISPGVAVFDARTPIDKVNEVLDADIPDNDEVDTIGGAVCGEFGRIPKAGEKITMGDGRLEVEILQADRKRVLKLKISRVDDNDGKENA